MEIKMTKLNKITKQQVADRLIKLLEKQVEQNNKPVEAIPASESNWIKELDARERGEEPYQHISSQTWNFVKREIGNPLKMRDEIVEWSENPIQPDHQSVTTFERNDKIYIGITEDKSTIDKFSGEKEVTSRWYHGYFVVSDDRLEEDNQKAINVYLTDIGYDIYSNEIGNPHSHNRFMQTLQPLETPDQYFEWSNGSNTSIIYQ
tara:strand:- start:3458 stop:4072 length:615 start_codon:yes stop_codon:yes gene_type:complete